MAAVMHAVKSRSPHLHCLCHPEMQVGGLEPCRTLLTSSSVAAAGASQVRLAKGCHASAQGPQTAFLPWTHERNA